MSNVLVTSPLIVLPRRALRALAPLVLLACLLVQFDAGVAFATQSAETASQPARALHPDVASRLLLANGYLEKERFEDALDVVDELRRLRKLKPVDLAQIHRFRGYILIAKGDMKGGVDEFEAALAENALDQGARQGTTYSLAQLYTQDGRYDRARELIDQWFATETEPKPEAWFLRAMILVQQEDFRAALEPAMRANEASPVPRESWLQLLAAVQFQLQDYPAVAGTLRQLIAVAPGTKRYWVQLATIENTIGQDESALATLGVARNGGLLSDDKEIRQHARMCFVQELPHCCTSTLEEGMAAGTVKRDAESYRLLASCYIAARETDRALEPLAKAGELEPGDDGFLLLGQLQLQKDRFDEARAALEQARVRARPEQRGQVELLLGIAELGSNRFDDAERAFRVAQADVKTRPAADSYLKHLEQKRAMRALRDSATVAAEEPGTPVSSAAAAETEPRL